VAAKALIAIILVNCTYNTNFADCVVHCSADMACPESLTCGMEGFCRAQGVAENCSTINGIAASCTGLAATCGPRRDEDCCSTSTIPGGAYFRGYDVASDSLYSSTNYSATVSAFSLDRFEVTVGRFRAFVATGTGTRENSPTVGAGKRKLNGIEGQGGWTAGWNTALVENATALTSALHCDPEYQSWTNAVSENEDLPINCITWYEAFAFCTWDSGFLPTEAEWNFAAVGGDEQRAYPWSNPAGSLAIDCAHANYNNNGYCTKPPNGAVNHVGSTSPNGDNKYALADLAGNVFEWTLDSFSSLSSSCDNCTNLNENGLRMLRGGGWDNLAAQVRTNHRIDRIPSFRHRAVGLRCARAVL